MEEITTREQVIERAEKCIGWMKPLLTPEKFAKVQHDEHQFHSLCLGFLPCFCETCVAFRRSDESLSSRSGSSR